MRIDATPKDCCLVRESLNTRKFSSVKYGIYIYIYWYVYTTGIIICLLYCTSSRSMGQFMQKLQKRQLHQMFVICLGCDTVDWSSCVRYLGSMCKILYTQVRCFIADCRNGAIDRSFYIPIPQFLRLFRWIGFLLSYCWHRGSTSGRSILQFLWIHNHSLL